MLPKNPSGTSNNNVDPITGTSANQLDQQTAQLAQNLRKVNSVFSEFVKDLAIKMEEVVSPSLGIKSATFEAFGNNFVTRGAMAGMDTILDSTEGMFGDKKALQPKQEVNPIQQAIEKQTQVLMSIFANSPTASAQKMSAAGDDTLKPDAIEKSEVDLVPHLDALNAKAQEILDFIKLPKNCSDDCSTKPLDDIGISLTKILEIDTVQSKNVEEILTLIKAIDGKKVKEQEKLAAPSKKDLLENTVKGMTKTLTSLSKTIKTIVSEIEKVGKSLKTKGKKIFENTKEGIEKVTGFFGKKKATIDIPELKPLSESPREKVVKKFGKKAVPASLAMMAKQNPELITDIEPKKAKKKSVFAKVSEKLSKTFGSPKDGSSSKLSTIMKAVPASLAMVAMKSNAAPMTQPPAFDPLAKTTETQLPPEEKEEKESDSGLGTMASAAAGALAVPAIKGAAKGIGKIGAVLGKGLMKSAKFIPGIGAAVALGDAAYNAYDGVSNAEKTFGTEKATTSQKIMAGLGGVTESLSFGLIDKESTAKKLHGMYSSLTGGADTNSNGEIVRLEKEIASKDSTKKESLESAPVVINNDNSTTKIVPGRKFVDNPDQSYQKYLDRTLKTG